MPQVDAGNLQQLSELRAQSKYGRRATSRTRMNEVTNVIYHDKARPFRIGGPLAAMVFPPVL
jgi:hypothetical protein